MVLPQRDNPFLTTKEVAELLHVNEKMVYVLVNDKSLPATKVTGKWLFPRRLVEDWLEVNITNYRPSAVSVDDSILLVAGSDDPLFQQTLGLFQQSFPGRIPFFANLGSMGGITALRRGLCHIGVCHLLQNDKQEYNFEFAEKELDHSPVFLNFSKREQGLLVKKGNPKNIVAVDDLVRKDITLANRPLGTGTRLLLDYELSQRGISTKKVKGYQKEVRRHLDAGLAVLSGAADVAPAIRTIAVMLDLDFIPLRWERFDLLIKRDRFFEKGIQDFIGLLQEAPFRQLAESSVGYDISLCGKMLFPDNLKKEEK